MLLHRSQEHHVGFFACFLSLCHLYCILQPPIDQPALDGESAAVGLSAADKPAMSPRMPVLHALNLIVGDFPGTFFAIGERKKWSIYCDPY
jgi:hypothetical protein